MDEWYVNERAIHEVREKHSLREAAFQGLLSEPLDYGRCLSRLDLFEDRDAAWHWSHLTRKRDWAGVATQCKQEQIFENTY